VFGSFFGKNPSENPMPTAVKCGWSPRRPIDDVGILKLTEANRTTG
jgi:hypothetical protein